MSRYRRDHRRASTEVPKSVIPITIREAVALVEIFGHAHSQISALGDADEETVSHSSGSVLIPFLYARIGLASTRGNGSIPLRVSEFGLLEAAVVNLESYQGNEVILCTGYGLLDDLASRERDIYPLCRVRGVLAFGDQIGDMTSGSTTASLT